MKRVGEAQEVPRGARETCLVDAGLEMRIERDGHTETIAAKRRRRWVTVFGPCRYWCVAAALVACGGVVEPLEQRGTPEPPDAGPDASCPEWQRPDGYCLAHCAPGQVFNCWRNAEEP